MLAGKIVADYAEVIECDVREMRTAGTVANGPDIRRGSFQPLVNLDVTAIGSFDASQLETDTLGVRSAAGGDEKIRASNHDFLSGAGEVESDRFA